MWDLVVISSDNNSFMCHSHFLLFQCTIILLIGYLKLNPLKVKTAAHSRWNHLMRVVRLKPNRNFEGCKCKSMSVNWKTHNAQCWGTKDKKMIQVQPIVLFCLEDLLDGSLLFLVKLSIYSLFQLPYFLSGTKETLQQRAEWDVSQDCSHTLELR